MPRPKAFDESQTLQKAVALFWRQGYHATSIQDVVDTLGINRASLYDTYGDKHTLFVKALERYRAERLQDAFQLLQGPGGALEKIRVLLDMTAKSMLADRERKGCFLLNSVMELVNQDQEVDSIATDYQKDLETALEQLIRKGQISGEITTTKDSRVLAQFAFSSLNSLHVTGKMNPDKNAMGHLLRVAIDAMKPGMEEALI